MDSFFYQKHADYIINVSNEGAAVSLETAAFIFSIISELVKNESKDQIWVDTGSGFSSFLLRSVAKQNKRVTVYSFDDSEKWLEKTQHYCESQKVSADNIILWKDRPDLNDKCSFVFHDLGDRFVRAATMKDVLAMMIPDGQIVFDDVHKGEIKSAFDKHVTEDKKYLVSDLSEMKQKTLDKLTRWSAYAIKLNND